MAQRAGPLESVAVNPGFWLGRRVFVTGHTGFKGAWLSLWLARLGARVAGYSLAPAAPASLFEAADVASVLESSAIADIRDLPRLRQALAGFEPEIVLHLAAQALVRPSYEDPVGTFATNVMGSVNLLESVRTCPGVKAVVVVTTDKCYENREWHWGYREDDALGGADPYSASKACAELAVAAYRRSFMRDGPALATARAGNVIGGGDWARDRLMADIALSLSDGRSVQIRNPGAIRPWQHVLDALHGYLGLAERLAGEGAAHARAWNFGPSDADVRTVAWVADQAVRLWGGAASWRHVAQGSVHEAGILKLDHSLARAQLGWSPRLDLVTALEWTIEWYKAHRVDPRAARALCNGQIGRFEERIAHG